jgi:hypothetical protein
MSSSRPSKNSRLRLSRLSSLLSASLPVALVALAACGTTTRFAPLNSSPHPLTPRPASMVQVLTTSLPAQPYIELGIIQGTQASELSLHEMPQIVATMRKEAGRRGCDALVLNGPNNTSPGIGQITTTDHPRSLQGFWGTCVVFTGERVAASPGAVPAYDWTNPPPLVAPAPQVAPAPAPQVVTAPPPAAAMAAPAPAGSAAVIVPPPAPREQAAAPALAPAK